MNKQEFLEELKKRIGMLEDSEQQDILAEYAQHIDLRMEGGLSEVEAIKDFGHIDQLVSEILGAYHVKADFQETPPKPSIHPSAKHIRNGCTSFMQKLKSAGTAVRDFMSRTWHRIQNWFSRVYKKVKGCFHRKPADSAPVQPSPKPPKERGPFFATLGSALRRGLNRLGRLCMALLYLCWNLCLLVCAAPVILVTLFIVLWLGVSIVLLCQGYPFMGITLCTIGALLVCCSLLGLGWTMIWHHHRKEIASYEKAE